MTSNNHNDGHSVRTQAGASLVKRSTVPPGKKYSDYRQYLRSDFYYSCAYCTISECEAGAIRFVIDHYEPRNARPDLLHDYLNLMYSCNTCNVRKSDRCPPREARAEGYRFFRPDHDSHQEHFRQSGIRLEGKTNVGEFSIDALDLNRLSLRRLRDIRDRLTKCDQYVAQGVLGLRSFHLDQLPRSVKGSALRAILQAERLAKVLAENIDELLREHARSPLIDSDPDEEERAIERIAKLKQYQTLFPGSWRAEKLRQR
jgi:HNH endonuclease